jgi:beta-mannanase
MMRRAGASLCVLAALLLAGGCGGSDSPDTGAQTATKQATRSQGTTAQPTTARTTTSKPAPAPDPNPAPAYWGAWIGDQLTGDEAPFDMGAVSKFEGLAGKPVSIVHFAAPFADCSQKPCTPFPFPAQEMEAVRRHGSIPFFSWSSQSIPARLAEPNYALSEVISGEFDSYIRRFAQAARNWGHPFFLRFDWEMNGNWFPWAERANDNRPGQFVQAWRHVHDIFDSVGADNATWVWCPYAGQRRTPMSTVYPGASYVDWTCLDGYNWGPRSGGIDNGWESFDRIFAASYRELLQIAPDKPIAIGETASTETGGSKADWLAQMLAALPQRYPEVRALVYFDKYDNGMDWPIETSASARQAFAKGISGPRWVANDYGSLDQSPIPPP